MRRPNRKRPRLLTPCVRVCKLENGICIGCKRTEEELSAWFWYTDEEKLQIMKQLEYR